MGGDPDGGRSIRNTPLSFIFLFVSKTFPLPSPVLPPRKGGRVPYIRKKTLPLKMLLQSYGITGRKLSEILGVSPSTGAARMANTNTLTVEELHIISTKGHIPINEIRDAIT